MGVIVKRHRGGIAGLAVLAAAVAVPVMFSAYRRNRCGDYTRAAEFRAIVGDYLI
jgi:hypothetical protein